MNAYRAGLMLGLATVLLVPAASIACSGCDCPPDSVNLYGINGTYSWNTTPPVAYDAGRNAGFQWIRFQIQWDELETTPGVYDPGKWAALNAEIEAAHSRGYSIVVGLYHTPAWARGGASARCGAPSADKAWTLPPTDPSYFYNFAHTIAQALKDRVAAYELGNEVNECFGWRGTAAQYQETMLAPGFDAIKAIDPSLVVVAPALYNSANFDPWLTYVDGSGKRYLTRSIDVYSLHTYESVTDAKAHLVAATPYARCGVDGRCLGLFWLTEFGYGSTSACGAATDPSGPGQALVDILAACYSVNSSCFKAFIWNILQPGSACDFSLLNDDGSPRPRYGKVANFISGHSFFP